MPSSAITARGLSVALSGRPVLRGVDLDVREGEWLGIVGPNGSGKTTLLRTLAGLLPYSGGVALRGRELSLWRGTERAREIALVRQQTDLPFAFSVREVVAMGRAPHLGWLSPLASRDREIVSNAITDLALQPLAARAVNALSGGEQQRVLLAQALAQEAPLLLLDEPTAHLDVRHRLDVLDRVRRLVAPEAPEPLAPEAQPSRAPASRTPHPSIPPSRIPPPEASGGKTVVAAMHDLEWAARYADRIAVLDRGQVVAVGAPAAVLTPALLGAVFGVRAEVESTASGVTVRYLGRHTPEASDAVESGALSPTP